MLKFRLLFTVTVALLLAACQTDDVISLDEEAPQAETEQTQSEQAETASEPSRPAVRLKQGQAECAIYYAITGKLMIEKRKTNGDILADCPPEASVGADISPSGSLPSGATARNLINRMVEKGVPKDVANQVSRSPAFRDWMREGG